MGFDGTPNERVIDEIVAMNQGVAEGDDLAILAYARGGFGIVLRKALDRLADYFEIALDAAAGGLRRSLPGSYPSPPR
jgi:hypothetical protein